MILDGRKNGPGAVVSALRRNEPAVRPEHTSRQSLSPRSLRSDRSSGASPHSRRGESPENAAPGPTARGSMDAFMHSHVRLTDREQGGKGWRDLDVESEHAHAASSGSSADSRGGGTGAVFIPWRRPSIASGEEAALGHEEANLASQKSPVEELVELLSSSALLEPLASLDTDQLLTELDFLVYDSGETIVQQGNRCIDGMYFFFEGTARAQKLLSEARDASTKIIRTFQARSRLKEQEDWESEDEKVEHRWISDDGEESDDGESWLPVPPETTNLWRYQATDYFGEFALWKNQPMSCSVVCDSVCRVVRIRRDMLERLGTFEDIVQKLHVVQDCLRDSRLRKQFESFDSDKDGLLSMQEAWDLFRALGCDYSLKEFEVGFPSMESAWSQELSYDDFFAFWNTCNFNDPLGVRSRSKAGTGAEASSTASMSEGSFASTCSSLPVHHAGVQHSGSFSSQLQKRTVTDHFQNDLLQPHGQDHVKELHTEIAGACHSPMNSSRSVSPAQRQDMPNVSKRAAVTSNQVEAVLHALGSFASLIAGRSATKTQKLQLLRALKKINYSTPNHQTGSVSLAIVKDQRCLKALLQTIGDEKEDTEVRRAAASVLQACLQISDSAAKMLLDRDFSAKMSVSEQRAAWRASFIAAIAPDVASSADVESAPVLSAFDNLGSPQRKSNQSVDQQSLPVREVGRDIQNERETPCARNTSTCDASHRRSRSHSPVRLVHTSRKRASLSPSTKLRRRRAPVRQEAVESSAQSVVRYLCPTPPPDPEAQFVANRAKLLEFLVTVPDFQWLDENQLGKLLDMLQVQIYSEDDVIVRKGDRGRSCFFVMYMGHAQTHVSGDPKSDHDQQQEESGVRGKREDALSASRGRTISPTDVFGWESAAIAHKQHAVLRELTTCLATSKMCTVLAVPFEAYILMLRGETVGEGFMNNQRDRGAQMEAAFRYLDHDGDGLLDHADICKLCNYVGIQSEPTFAENLCAVIGHESNHLVNGVRTARFRVDLQQFSAWWDGLNFFDVNVDTMARELEDELERRRVVCRMQQFEEEQEHIRRIRERKGTPPPPVTIIYDQNGRRHDIVSDGTQLKFNLPQLQEKLRPPPKVDNEQTVLRDGPQNWREYLPAPDFELWGSRLQDKQQQCDASGGLSSVKSAARASPKQALFSPRQIKGDARKPKGDNLRAADHPKKGFGKPPLFSPGISSPYATSPRCTCSVSC